MGQANKKTHDMSVEEILKSIRGIINSHKEGKKDEEDILELTNIVQEDKNKTVQAGLQKEEDNYLVSDKVVEEASLSFREFINKAKEATRDEKKTKTLTLEELVAQMMKPQLKEWLDKNLPILVKEIVEKELKRLIPEEEE